MDTDTNTTEPSTEKIHKEIESIQEFVDELPEVSETLRKAPRVIGVVGENIEAFNERMNEEFGHDETAYIDPRWESQNGEFLALLTVEETDHERRAGETVELNSRPLNKKEIDNIDSQLRESNLLVDGLTQELYEDIQQFRVKS